MYSGLLVCVSAALRSFCLSASCCVPYVAWLVCGVGARTRRCSGRPWWLSRPIVPGDWRLCDGVSLELLVCVPYAKRGVLCFVYVSQCRYW